jgi:hypothetical protein
MAKFKNHLVIACLLTAFLINSSFAQSTETIPETAKKMELYGRDCFFWGGDETGNAILSLKSKVKEQLNDTTIEHSLGKAKWSVNCRAQEAKPQSTVALTQEPTGLQSAVDEKKTLQQSQYGFVDASYAIMKNTKDIVIACGVGIAVLFVVLIIAIKFISANKQAIVAIETSVSANKQAIDANKQAIAELKRQFENANPSQNKSISSAINELKATLSNVAGKADANNALLIKIQNGKPSNNDNIFPNTDIVIQSQTNSQISTSESTPFTYARKFPVRLFYLDLFQKGLRENTGEKIYKCETDEYDEKKAIFEINSLNNTTKPMFFNSTDLNNSSICQYKGNAVIGNNMMLRMKGVLRQNSSGMWMPEKAVSIEFT